MAPVNQQSSTGNRFSEDTDELLRFVETGKLFESFDNINSNYLLENIPVIYPMEDSL